MADLVIPQPTLIDGQGNLQLNGRNSIYLPVKSWTDITKTAQINISARLIFFEVATAVDPTNDVTAGFRQQLTVDPNDAFGLLLDVPDLHAAGILVNFSSRPPFVFRDETGSSPSVPFEGVVITRGFEGEPP